MSYANRPSSAATGRSTRDTERARSPERGKDAAEPIRRPRGRPYSARPDLEGAGTLAVGIAIGLAIGVSAALLLAPASGDRTRRRLARGASRARLRASDIWDDLGETITDSLREARGAWSARDRGRKGPRRNGD